jgi:hypothetical protein
MPAWDQVRLGEREDPRNCPCSIRTRQLCRELPCISASCKLSRGCAAQVVIFSNFSLSYPRGKPARIAHERGDPARGPIRQNTIRGLRSAANLSTGALLSAPNRKLVRQSMDYLKAHSKLLATNCNMLYLNIKASTLAVMDRLTLRRPARFKHAV